MVGFYGVKGMGERAKMVESVLSLPAYLGIVFDIEHDLQEYIVQNPKLVLG